VPLLSARPCGNIELTVKDLKPAMEILAYCEPRSSKPGWLVKIKLKISSLLNICTSFLRYRVLVTSVTNGQVVGTICLKAEKTMPKAQVKFCYRTIQFPTLVPRSEWSKMKCDLSLIKRKPIIIKATMRS
jgi:hypothetical protein